MPDNSSDETISIDAPMRFLHVTGGLGLLVGSNRVSMLTSPGDESLTLFSILHQTSVTSLLNGQSGLRVIGLSHFTSAEEMSDPVTQNFVIGALGSDNQCLARTQGYYWNGIANALHEEGRGVDALLASRVHSQIRLCIARLERLSIAYRTVLSIVSSYTKPTDGGSIHISSDKYAEYIGSEYRSFLNELYGLRDAVLSLAYRLRYNRTDPFRTQKLKSLVMADTGIPGKLISESMFLEGGDKLIEHMSLYRSIAQHCLGQTNPIFGDAYQLYLSRGPLGTLPFLVYPLFDDIEEMRAIERGSSKGVLGRPSQTEAERFMRIYPHLDGLEFCYDCFVRLLNIAEAIASDLAIVPKTITITDEDIIEATVTDENGNTRRFKRDLDTGKLVND